MIGSPQRIRCAASCCVRARSISTSIRRARRLATTGVALVRVEQLFPFPFAALGKVLRRYRNAEIVWCQEEPQNMGAWNFVDRRIEEVLAGLDIAAKRPRFVGRAEAASPATGLFQRHVEEQTQLVADGLAA